MDRIDRTKLSVTNHQILRSLSVTEATKLICYLCHDCERCPAKEDKNIWSIKECWNILAAWLQEAKDEEFWEHIKEE